jgi:ABC-2 type transport system permease protein
MYALFKKELNAFFSGAGGYLIILAFLLTNGLLMWGFEGNFNVLDSGYAQLDTLFQTAPFLFLIFIPAVCMRLFTDEQKDGTLELLLTKPLTDLEIVVSKYLAGLTLVLLSILPTLVYYFSVYFLGETIGNLDSAGIFGSYIGLFFLASSFVAISTYASTLSDNAIIAFIIGLMMSGLCYMGWELIAGLASSGKTELFFSYLGINSHYSSLSKGVIDFSDVLYFLSLNTLFISLSQLQISRRKWK